MVYDSQSRDGLGAKGAEDADLRSKLPFELSELRKDLVDYLVDTAKCMRDADRLIRKGDLVQQEGAAGQYSDLASRLDAEAEKVRLLELRMAIVAPMKAGKSTIINALLGQSMLPTRNTAMTTIATEIVANMGQEQSSLRLGGELLNRFGEAARTLHKAICAKGVAEVLAETSEYPQLEPLVKQLAQSSELGLRSPVTGQSKIQEVLTLLNDFNRLCGALRIDFSPSGPSASEELPVLETPFWGVSSQPTSIRFPGRLVIIDTPGPNEWNRGLDLETAIYSQLGKASLVLLVLDYTQLNAKAAATLRDEVRKVVDLMGEERLVLLVNKIDQRRIGDLTTDQVRQFVAGHLGLSKVSSVNRVIEISASRAFLAASAARAMHLSPTNGSRRNLQQQVLEECYPVDWQERIDEVGDDEFRQLIARLFRRSGFERFLKEVVNWLLEHVGRECTTMATDLGLRCVTILRSDMGLRRNALEADEKKLRAELQKLQSEIGDIAALDSKLQQDIEEEQRRLGENFKARLKRQKEEAESSVRTFAQKIYDSDQSILDQFRKFNFSRESVRRFSFGSYDDAKNFSHEVSQEAFKMAQAKVRECRSSIRTEIHQAQVRLRNKVTSLTLPILQRAIKRLEAAFKAYLDLPNLKLEDEHGDVPLIHPEQKQETETIRERQIKHERRWYTLYLWRHEVETTVSKEVTKTTYEVDSEKVIANLHKSIQDNVRGLEDRLAEFVRSDLKEATDSYLEELKVYLTKYEDALKWAVNERSSDADCRRTLVAEISNVEKVGRQCGSDLERIKGCLDRPRGLADGA